MLPPCRSAFLRRRKFLHRSLEEFSNTRNARGSQDSKIMPWDILGYFAHASRINLDKIPQERRFGMFTVAACFAGAKARR
jgi:hypothetical protein